MRMTLPLLTALLCLAAARAQAADPGACYAIPQADARQHCLARAHANPGLCYAIQAPKRRAECLAELRGREKEPVDRQ